jgi:hypothetical protein
MKKLPAALAKRDIKTMPDALIHAACARYGSGSPRFKANLASALVEHKYKVLAPKIIGFKQKGKK